MILTESQVRSLAYNSGFRGIALDYVVKICKCESGFNTDAHNTTGEDSRGLMQINVNAHPNYSNYNLFDPQVNMNVAYAIFTRAGKTFRDWTCARMLNIVNPSDFYIIAGVGLLGMILYVSVAQD